MSSSVVSTAKLPWLLCLPGMATLVLAAAGCYPTWRIGGRAGVEGMLAGQLLVLLVVYATLFTALWRMVPDEAVGRLQAGLKVGLIRLVLTVGAMVVIAWRRWAEPKVFLTWVAIAYVVMAKLETVVLLRWNRVTGARA
ncbi:MAG: hypothetical protein ACUVXJ_09290 [Phycisphaerae bacterium]